MAKKIKLLFTISNFNTAGSGKVVYDLVNGLNKDKFEIEIACESKEGAFFSVVESLGLPIHIFETKTPYRPFYNLLFRILKISKFYKKHNYDIVHSWQWSSDWTEALAARFIGIKWIYTKKAMGFNARHWHIKSYIANFIITINDEMRNYFPNKKAQALIPLGIDTEYYNPTKVEKERLGNSSNFQIITVANLVPVKGIEILINALEKLNTKTIELSILGDCDNAYGAKMIELTKTLGLQEQIHFLGKKLDVRPYFKSADLYIIPTLNEGRKEGMPMALVEAMSMAVPILGSNITGINYVLRDFKSLLFKPGDTEDLALKIKQFIGIEKQKQIELGQDLRTYCENNFAMNSFITAHEILYHNILKSG